MMTTLSKHQVHCFSAVSFAVWAVLLSRLPPSSAYMANKCLPLSWHLTSPACTHSFEAASIYPICLVWIPFSESNANNAKWLIWISLSRLTTLAISVIRSRIACSFRNCGGIGIVFVSFRTQCWTGRSWFFLPGQWEALFLVHASQDACGESFDNHQNGSKKNVLRPLGKAICTTSRPKKSVNICNYMHSCCERGAW